MFNSVAAPEPTAATTARTVEQVRTAIRYARDRGLGVRVHSTGHGAAAARPVRDAVLIRTAIDGGVTLDPRARIARVPAGTRWEAVVRATEPHGLAAAHGSSGTVGVVGYALQGGLSPYGRLVGLAANSVRAVELVTADGQHRRVDAGSDPELFWALRGGGGGFGVVTAIELDLFPVTTVITGAAYWPGSLADRLLTAWLAWAQDAPDIATTSVRVMNFPDVPEVPRELAGRTTFTVDGVVHADDPESARRCADDLLGPLRAIGPPLLDTWQKDVPSAVLRAHMDPEGPLPIVGDHMLLDEFDAHAVAPLLDVIGEGSGSPLVGAGLRQLGGAYAAPRAPGGVLDRLTANYSYAGSGLAADPDAAAALRAHCAKVRSALARWNTGRVVPSFVEDFAQDHRHLDARQAAAVDRVRARIDPGRLFRDDVSPTDTRQE
ncbi:FAD-binding oxidoreductase [Amycolatopsis cihanbeyliensis]|uniref:FAD-binding oxidoreductase n=1 Tax=Amycolatopsis cihanbeyliensis TaxID=1128664 RepID=UPI001FEB4777|nr:FAD-dependent oxidoreductase [Amycolatopsis cihanbeyliensis]